VAIAGTEIGPICCCGGLKHSGRKRGSGGISFPVAALIYIGV